MRDMLMTESAAWMIGLMAFLIIVVGGVLVTFRVFAGREVRESHAHQGPSGAERPRRALAAGSGQRPGDAVEDV